MEQKKLEKLSRLGGKVVELRLNNHRHALGFVYSADTDRIVLVSPDGSRRDVSVSYPSGQSADFVQMHQAEPISLEHASPMAGTRVMLKLKNSVKTCGYVMPSRNGAVMLAREVLSQGRNTRPHRHRRDEIESCHILKPIEA